MSEREVSADFMSQDEAEVTLRPQRMADFVGQDAICDNLQVFIASARRRGAAMDHVLIAGPPGLGKTTMARIIAHELGVNFRSTVGPTLYKIGDLAALLTGIENNDVMFIDEIHRMNCNVEEFLYSAMEDFHMDIIIGEGPGARSVRIDLHPFTLIGATTRTGLLTTPLRDRFGIPLRLDYYSEEDLDKIIRRAASLLGVEITNGGVAKIAARSRGTPRIAGRLLRRLRDFAIIENNDLIDEDLALKSLEHMGVGKLGLDIMDRRYLEIIGHKFNGGPVGVDTIAAALNEARDMIEEVIEPYLIKIGFLNRSTRGRIITPSALSYLGIKVAGENTASTLFD